MSAETIGDSGRPIFCAAVRHFWGTRDRQLKAQRARGAADRGARAAVTGGKQMNGFVDEIVRRLRSVGVEQGDIYTGQRKDVPGFYRPTKEWDILVVGAGGLVAAIELKSQVGPSFGNNLNNRTEEALGSAVDLWTAYREGAFQTSPRPWLGYVFLLEDCPQSRSPVAVRESHFRVFPEFREASYANRYELLCRRLVLERQYDAACFITADRRRAEIERNYDEPARDLSVGQFVSQLLTQVGKLQRGP